MAGVDDFALRRRHRYATVVINAETHERIDVPPDRTADTLEAWLRRHPDIEAVHRDGSATYAEAIHRALPDPAQVGDRRHSWKNPREAALSKAKAHSACRATVLDTPNDGPRAQTTPGTLASGSWPAREGHGPARMRPPPATGPEHRQTLRPSCETERQALLHPFAECEGDELGYMELDRRGAELLFQVLTERKEKNSVAIASNESFGGWTKTLTDPRLCAAIVDRLAFGGNIMETGTDSFRLARTRARAEQHSG